MAKRGELRDFLRYTGAVLICGMVALGALAASREALSAEVTATKEYLLLKEDQSQISKHITLSDALTAAQKEQGTVLIVPPRIKVVNTPKPVKISWNLPTTRVDGSVLVGRLTYRIFVDGKQFAETTARSYTLTGLGTGPHEVYITAVDMSGLESPPSDKYRVYF